MPRDRRVVVVGKALGERVGAVLGDHPVDVVRAGDAETALVELAASPADALVCPAAALDADVSVVEAASRRDDVAVLPVAGVESTVVQEEGVDAGETAVGTGTDLDAALRAVLGLDSAEPPEADPLGPLEFTAREGQLADVSGSRMPPLGHPPDGLEGRDIADVVHPDDREALAGLAGVTGPDRALLRLEHDDGDWGEVWVEHRDHDGPGERYRVLRRDVRSLPDWFPRGPEAETVLAALYAHAPIHLFVKDERARHRWVSRFHAGDPGDTIGKRDVDFDWGAYGEETYTDDLSVIEHGEPILWKEEYWPERDVWSRTSKIPWTDEDGEVRGLVGATYRITERKSYERRLERENERLERFATIVSHDLRTPINVATGHLEMAKDDPTRDHLDRVERALARMDRITADVLTMVKKGAWVDETSAVAVDSAARRGWDMAETGSATLDLRAEGTVAADPDRLQHLFEHAVRHAVDHGDPDVTVSVGDLEAGFFVESEGIPYLEAEHVLETGQVTAAEATGLSLEIVRQVVAAHDWTIAVTERDDGGARVAVTGVDRP